MSEYNKRLAELENTKGENCSGGGICNNAEPGDISYSTWNCTICGGTGFRKEKPTIGDLVKDPNSQTYLCCGSGVYPYAVVMSVEPLILISEGTDMRWDTLDIKRLAVVGQASFWTVMSCLRRFTFKEKMTFLKAVKK